MARAISLSPTAPAPPIAPARPTWWPVWQGIVRNKPALISLVVIILLFLTAIFGPSLAPYSYSAQDLNNVVKPPSPQHLLGTDDLGRDMLTRLIYGARSVVFVIVLTTVITVILGLPLGAAAGYFGGWVDTVISRLIDFLFSFPDLLFIFFIAATIKPGIINWMRGIGLSDFVRSGYADYAVVIVALGIVGWAGLARLIRGQILALREKDFVIGARAVGVPSWKIIYKYLIPNALSPLIVSLSMGLGGIALSEGILSFLGIGLQPPNPSWGNIIADNAPVHWRDWPAMLWLIGAPFVVISSVVFAFNFFGDGLNEALNPELH